MYASKQWTLVFSAIFLKSNSFMMSQLSITELFRTFNNAIENIIQKRSRSASNFSLIATLLISLSNVGLNPKGMYLSSQKVNRCHVFPSYIKSERQRSVTSPCYGPAYEYEEVKFRLMRSTITDTHRLTDTLATFTVTCTANFAWLCANFFEGHSRLLPEVKIIT